jgi:hypothetical protein
MDDFIQQQCSAATLAAASRATSATNDTYTIQVVMAGDVKDFDVKAQDALRSSIANNLGVSMTNVNITVKPGSIVANLQISQANAANVIRLVGQLNDKSVVPDPRFPIIGATMVSSASSPGVAALAGTQTPLFVVGQGSPLPTTSASLNIPAPPFILLGTLPPVVQQPVYVSPVLRPLAASSVHKVRWMLLGPFLCVAIVLLQ